MTEEEFAKYIAEKEREEAEMARAEARAEAEVERARQPLDRDRILELLIRYFEGPITERDVEHLTTFFETEGEKWWDSDQDAFGSLIRYRGYAWKEEVSEDRRYMAPIDHLLLMGHTLYLAFQNMNGEPFPAPKLHCPEVFVGVWEQVKPLQASKERILWHLDRDSSFRSSSPDLPAPYSQWCVQRSYGLEVPTYTFTLKNESGGSWDLYTVTPTARELVGHAWDKREFRLRRVK